MCYTCVAHSLLKASLAHRVFQILTYAILSPTLGNYVDDTIAKSNAHVALFNIAGVRNRNFPKPMMVPDAHMTLGSFLRTFGNHFPRELSTKGRSPPQPKTAA